MIVEEAKSSLQLRQKNPRIAVIIPCYNEEAAIARVITDFKLELPDAEIHVFDNNSTDKSVELSRKSGAIVSFEKRQGKGNVVRSMFQKVDADIYVMVDGDGTYPANCVHKLLDPVLKGDADMVVGSRLLSESSEMKGLNRFGNLLFLLSLNTVFGASLSDILSGYRVMTREFVRLVPVLSSGFQIETELTIEALRHHQRIIELPVTLRRRVGGSESKIRIISDGLKILWTIFDLFRTYKPLTVFGGAGVLAIVVGFVLGFGVVLEFWKTGLVPRFPTAILASALVLSGLLSIAVGLILNTQSRNFKELSYHLTALSQRIEEQQRRN